MYLKLGRRRTLYALLVLTMLLAPLVSAMPAFAEGPNVPYDLPVQLPAERVTSPAVDPNAPYTPVVLSIIA